MIKELHLKKTDKPKMILVMTLCFTLLTLIVADSLYAQTNYEKETMLTANDAATDDYYGYSVSIDGNLAENQRAHHYKINFDAADYNLASGMYFYQLKAGSIIKQKKRVFIK